jgi:predicted permease
MKLFHRVRALFHKRKLDAEMDEEMRSHIEMQTQENIEAGMKPVAARHAALRQFGWTESIKETCRDQRGIRWVEGLVGDLRFGARMLRKSPGFTVLAVLTLGLGIGVNLALFALLDDQLLRPQPVSHPEELWAIRPSDSSGEPKFLNLSTPYYEAIRAHHPLFKGVIGFAGFGAKLRAPEGWDDVSGLMVSGNYFSFLGVQPVIGRGFLPEEDAQPGASSVAVISYRFWERRFQKDPAVAGKTLILNGQVVQVVGVAPPDFDRFGSSRDLWVPLSMRSLFGYPPPYSPVYSLLGRLPRGGSPTQAADSLAPVVQDVTKALAPERHKAGRIPPYANGNASFTRVGVIRAGYGALAAGWDRRPLIRGVGLAAIGTLLVLLIAGSNLANLLLARALSRRKEMAVRLALGASRWKLIRQTMLEGLLLAGLGGLAAALLLAWLGQALLPIMSVGGYNPRSLFPDVRIIAAALVGALVTGAGFSAFPAFQATRFDPLAALKGSGVGRRSRRWSLQRALVVAQVGGSLVLLSGACLCLRDIAQMLRTDVGFRPEPLVVACADLEKAGFTTNTAPVVAAELRRRFSELPEVEVVGMTAHAPFQGWHGRALAGDFEGYSAPEGGRETEYGFALAGPDSFRALGIPIIAGRDFSDSDFAVHRPIALVNQSFARKFWPNQMVLGKHLHQWRVFYEVVGIVADARLDTPAEPPGPMVFFAALDDDSALNPVFIIRARKHAPSLVGPVRAELAGLNPRLGDSRVFTAVQAMRSVLHDQRNALNLLAGLASLALGLTILGAYGIMSYLVAQRTQEIGIRMAVGARRTDVARLILRSGLGIAWAGIGLGFPVALCGASVLRHAIYGVSQFDPPAYGAAALAVLLAIFLACWLPARRAAKVDLMTALRYE